MIMDIDINKIFEEKDETIRSDILVLILDHLHREKLFNAANILEDEVSSKLGAVNSKRVKMLKFHKAILNGDWDNSIKLLASLAPKSSQRSFLYFILRQQYLELIDSGERERAFQFLVKHLKPLEDIAVSQGSVSDPSEFKELCYLLTCSAVGEADSIFFREWKHYYHQRELLADQLVSALHKHIQDEGGIMSYGMLPSVSSTLSSCGSNAKASDSRLTDLLKQSFAFQIAKHYSASQIDCRQADALHIDNSEKEKSPAAISSQNSECILYPCVRRIVDDYVPAVLPSRAHAILSTGPGGENGRNLISSLAFLRSDVDSTSTKIVGGGNAGVLYCWDYKGDDSAEYFPSWSVRLRTPARRGSKNDNLEDESHGRYRFATSIRDICCSNTHNSKLVAASRSDGSVCVLSESKDEIIVPQGNVKDETDVDDAYCCKFDIVGQSKVHDGDALAVSLFNSGECLLSGGFDHHVAVVDVNTMQTMKMFYGHTAAVSQVGSNRPGNLIYSSSRDGTVMFWDLLSGVSVRCLTPYASSYRGASTQPQSHTVPQLPATAMYSAGRGYSHTFHSSQSASNTPPLSDMSSLNNPGSAAYAGSGAGGEGAIGSSGAVNSIQYPSCGGSEITSCSLSEDGKYLLVSSRFLPAKLIDLRTGNVLVKYKNSIDKRANGYGSTNPFYRPTFCTNDQAVVGGSCPGNLSMWSTLTGSHLPSLSLSSLPVDLNSHMRQFKKEDFSRSVYDKYSGVLGSVSSSGVVLWR